MKSCRKIVLVEQKDENNSVKYAASTMSAKRKEYIHMRHPATKTCDEFIFSFFCGLARLAIVISKVNSRHTRPLKRFYRRFSEVVRDFFDFVGNVQIVENSLDLLEKSV